LDGALSNLIWLKMSLLTAGGLGWMTSKGPFQPKACYDSPVHMVLIQLHIRLQRPSFFSWTSAQLFWNLWG